MPKKPFDAEHFSAMCNAAITFEALLARGELPEWAKERAQEAIAAYLAQYPDMMEHRHGQALRMDAERYAEAA